MRKLSAFALLLPLCGCQSLTPQQVSAFCALAADGTVLAIASTTGGAQTTAQKAATFQQVVPCNAAVAAVGALVAKP